MKSILLAVLMTLAADACSEESKTDRGITSNSKQVIAIDQYDQYFKKWSKKYNLKIDERLLRAVCTKESQLNPKAVSKEGALGLCQFMKGTWKAISAKNKLILQNGYFNPEQSIHATSYYLSLLHKSFENKKDSIEYTLAAFNAGIGNVIKADKQCGQRGYSIMLQCLPKITSSSNARTTKEYVSSILATL